MSYESSCREGSTTGAVRPKSDYPEIRAIGVVSSVINLQQEVDALRDTLSKLEGKLGPLLPATQPLPKAEQSGKVPTDSAAVVQIDAVSAQIRDMREAASSLLSRVQV